MKWMLVVGISAVLLAGALYAGGPAPSLDPITVDYPSEGSLFPPDIIAPTFQWRDPAPAAAVWRIDVTFADHSHSIQLWSQGEKMKLGELDTSLVGYVPPTLTPEQQAAHTWQPDPKTWAEIKKHSVKAAATVTITGFRSEDGSNDGGQALSSGHVNLQTSKDPVGAPIFYRDVPLIPPPPEQGERGVIKPLPDSVLPKIKWRLRYVSGTESKVVMARSAHLRQLPLHSRATEDPGHRRGRPGRTTKDSTR